MMVVPEMIIGHTAYKTGSDITLSCSAQSKPAVSYKWRFNGMFLNEQSPQLSLQNTRENQTGSYTCLAYNNVTLRYATMSTMIKIVGEATFIVTKCRIVGSEYLIIDGYEYKFI
jgi:CD209 antigen